jgi:hypothetical protein
MPGLDPGIHSATSSYVPRVNGMDRRVKPGDDVALGVLNRSAALASV